MENVEVLIFDVFGTTVDWYTTVFGELKALGETKGPSGTEDWHTFAQQWRKAYMDKTREYSQTATDPEKTPNVDAIHREALENMLASEQWAHIGKHWDTEVREQLNTVWHRLGGWSDTSKGLYALKKNFIIASLSNGNARLLVDMAKHADLPWDAVLAGDIIGSYKPNPKMYLQTAKFLGAPPERCAMVACHLWDLRGAAKNGLKTIYVHRDAKEPTDETTDVKTKADGGEVDVVVHSFTELASVLEKSK
ncbi:HAD-like protein [Schizophyllum commune Tattone D]|nr:HAD-like protein [Schizophyllum commune Tattone D]